MGKKRKKCYSCGTQVPNNVIMCPQCGFREFTEIDHDVFSLPDNDLQTPVDEPDDEPDDEPIIDFDNPYTQTSEVNQSSNPKMHKPRLFSQSSKYLFFVLIAVLIFYIYTNR